MELPLIQSPKTPLKDINLRELASNKDQHSSETLSVLSVVSSGNSTVFSSVRCFIFCKMSALNVSRNLSFVLVLFQSVYPAMAYPD